MLPYIAPPHPYSINLLPLKMSSKSLKCYVKNPADTLYSYMNTYNALF